MYMKVHKVRSRYMLLELHILLAGKSLPVKLVQPTIKIWDFVTEKGFLLLQALKRVSKDVYDCPQILPPRSAILLF